MAIRSQSDQRRSMTFIDQWGRRFEAGVEKETGDPCTQLCAMNWRAPVGVNWPIELGAANAYYKLRTDPDNPSFLWFDGARFVADVEKAWEDYEEEVYKVGLAIVGAEFNRNNVSREVRLKAGSPPAVPVLLAQAMAAGDRWCLGLTAEQPIPMPDWAKPYFVTQAKVVPTFNTTAAPTDGVITYQNTPRRVNGRFVAAGA